MIRKIDNLGRIVIPKEMRKAISVDNGDPIHMEMKDNQIIITNPGQTAEDRILAAIDKLLCCGEELDPQFQKEMLEILNYNPKKLLYMHTNNKIKLKSKQIDKLIELKNNDK